jgi:hypothetical protein
MLYNSLRDPDATAEQFQDHWKGLRAVHQPQATLQHSPAIPSKIAKRSYTMDGRLPPNLLCFFLHGFGRTDMRRMWSYINDILLTVN